MRAEHYRPNRTKLATDSSEHTLTDSPGSKRQRLYLLIGDYHKSLSNIDLKELSQEEGEGDWIAEQTQFVKLLRRKLDRYVEHPDHQKYSRLLLECEDSLRRLNRNSPPKLHQAALQDQSSIEAISPIRPKLKHTIARSIDKLKETITVKENLLQKNYETEHDKNKHLTVKLRQQQSQLEELSRQLKKVQDELLNAHDRLSQQQVTSHSRQNKEMMLLIKQNEEKDETIQTLEREVTQLRSELQSRSDQKSRQRFNEQQVFTLMETNQQLKTSNNMLQLKVDRLSQTVQELDVEVRRITGQQNDSSELDYLKDENHRLKEENIQLESRIEHVARELERLAINEREFASMRSENEELRKHLVYKTKNMEMLEGQLHELEEKMLQLDEGNLEAVKSLKEARLEIRELQERCDLYKEKYFRLKQNLPEEGRTSRQTHRQSQPSCQGASTCGDLSTSRLAVNRPGEQSKKLRVLEDLKSLVRSHRHQFEKLR